ncbi:polysaccharide deacetylase family protein [Deinococcus detaillensis]|uniref:Polysaccharide deacetylase family protein n=1 Tax=Deinococcus detaillensis TaxID=2592048 RepID=A0A553V5S8_9DEIO|nr:polysaccharide deacetylase family protein [Deinococcus detaillensis]TSA87828.1 polysaccharide deacetylase family protein [Deinococcus detaillensis]
MRKVNVLAALPLALLTLAYAQSPISIPARPLKLPGETQPIAPGTRRAAPIPEITLTPPMAQVLKIQYLSNGHIEAAGAVLLLQPNEVEQARQLAARVAARTLAARPSLSEVDVSVYNKVGYGGFGGPLPILTLSAPRGRISEVAAWAAGSATYDRAWEALGSVTPGSGDAGKIADKVREQTINFYGSVDQKLADARTRSASQIKGGIQDGLLYGGNILKPLAALTFDDAPHPMYEPLLLDLLRRGQVKATFFVIGRNARAYPYFVRDMVQQGHEVGNHTYHHVRLPPLSLNTAITEMSLTNQTLRRLTGQPIKYFRPPGGDYTPQTLDAARALGLTTVFWTDDPADFQNPGDAVLKSRFDRKLHPGGIVLLHDNAAETMNVFGDFLKYAKRRGVSLTTVSEMLAGKSAGLIKPASPIKGAKKVPNIDKLVQAH